MLTFIACTRLFSQTPYRLRFRSRFFKQAFQFGYPLMVNGVEIAVGSRADRYLVGAMLDLPALGLYSVLTLATTVPTSVVTRITQVVTMSALFNASQDKRMFEARLRLASAIIPVLAGLLALGILTLMNDVVPLVFGHKFVASRPMVILLALTVFVRLVRNDPGTSLLLTEGRTRRLALANLFVMGGIVFSIIFLYLSRTIEASVAGRLAGELIGFIAMHYLARVAFQGVGRYNIIAITAVSALLGIVGAIVCLMPPGRNLPANLALLVICAAINVPLIAAPRSAARSCRFPSFRRARATTAVLVTSSTAEIAAMNWAFGTGEIAPLFCAFGVPRWRRGRGRRSYAARIEVTLF